MAASPSQAQTSTPLATCCSDAERTPQRLLIQPALSHHPSVEQEYRYTKVIESEELTIRVHIADLRLQAKLPEQITYVVAEVTTLSDDELDLHNGPDYAVIPPAPSTSAP